MGNLYFNKLQQDDFQIFHSIYRTADSYKRAISLYPCQYWVLLNAFKFCQSDGQILNYMAVGGGAVWSSFHFSDNN